MQKILTDFAAQIGLPLSQAQAEKLLAYAQRVWDKKDMLNLTSSATFQEVLTRHICDGLRAAAEIAAQGKNNALQLADAGAGCGYIGMTLAVALPQAQVTLLESLEKRCKFMSWAALTCGISNVRVKNVRLGQGTDFAFDALTERAMGKLPDIFSVCMSAVKPGGLFIAFQGEHPQTVPGQTPFAQTGYTLPGDNTPRYLVLFRKGYA